MENAIRIGVLAYFFHCCIFSRTAPYHNRCWIYNHNCWVNKWTMSCAKEHLTFFKVWFTLKGVIIGLQITPFFFRREDNKCHNRIDSKFSPGWIGDISVHVSLGERKGAVHQPIKILTLFNLNYSCAIQLYNFFIANVIILYCHLNSSML